MSRDEKRAFWSAVQREFDSLGLRMGGIAFSLQEGKEDKFRRVAPQCKAFHYEWLVRTGGIDICLHFEHKEPAVNDSQWKAVWKKLGKWTGKTAFYSGNVLGHSDEWREISERMPYSDPWDKKHARAAAARMASFIALTLPLVQSEDLHRVWPLETTQIDGESAGPGPRPLVQP